MRYGVWLRLRQRAAVESALCSACIGRSGRKPCRAVVVSAHMLHRLFAASGGSRFAGIGIDSDRLARLKIGAAANERRQWKAETEKAMTKRLRK